MFYDVLGVPKENVVNSYMVPNFLGSFSKALTLFHQICQGESTLFCFSAATTNVAASAFYLDNALLTGLKAAGKSILLRNHACRERWGPRRERLVPKLRLLEALKPPMRAFSGIFALVGGDVALEMGVKLGRKGLAFFPHSEVGASQRGIRLFVP